MPHDSFWSDFLSILTMFFGPFGLFLIFAIVHYGNKPKLVELYADRLKIEKIGDIFLKDITSFDTPILDYPDGNQRLYIRRKWKLTIRLDSLNDQSDFKKFTYKFLENIQKLPEHERPKFKTIHGSIIARLFGVSILVAMAIATFFALKMGHIPGTLILAWSAAIPIALLFIKGQRTP